MQLPSAVQVERWNGVVIDIYQRDMFVTGFQVSAFARNACYQRKRNWRAGDMLWREEG